MQKHTATARFAGSSDGRPASAGTSPGEPGFAVDNGVILNALPDAVLLLDGANRIRYANAAAEQLFQASMEHLRGQDLRRILTPAHPLIGLIHQVREGGSSLTEYGISLDSPRFSVAGAKVPAGPESGRASCRGRVCQEV